MLKCRIDVPPVVKAMLGNVAKNHMSRAFGTKEGGWTIEPWRGQRKRADTGKMIRKGFREENRMSDKFVTAVNHIDLAFVFEEKEHEEFLELYLERMLQVLERIPESHFGIEQVCHFRKLEKRRPDLFEKVKEMLRANRIELMGAMGSSAETNFPNGESFVRNQLMGLRWAKEHLETEPTVEENSELQSKAVRIESRISDHGNMRKEQLICVNGLPWRRREWVLLKEREFNGIQEVLCGGIPLPIVKSDGKTYFQADLPSGGIACFDAVFGGKSDAVCGESMGSAILRNGEPESGAGSEKETLREIGNEFQIESSDGTELFAMNGRNRLSGVRETLMEECIEISGEFPNLWWNREENHLRWMARFGVRKDESAVRLHLSLDWKGTAARIRLKLPCLVNAAKAFYEVPFGVTERSAYGVRPTARGEWPDAWVKPSEYSSQYGQHEYDFLLIPYRGSWKEANVLKMAQEFNNEILAFRTKDLRGLTEEREQPAEGKITMDDAEKAERMEARTYLRVDRPNLVLSGVKYAEDGSGDLVIRLYESYGEETTGLLYVDGAKAAWFSDVTERKGRVVSFEGDAIPVHCDPFEIKTFRMKRL